MSLEDATRLLARGEVVGIPTETVYGLAADGTNPLAVRRVFGLKGRPVDHPVILHAVEAEAARRLVAAWPEAAQRLAERFWPGPLTLVLPRGPDVPDEVTGGLDTVGVRVSSHPLTLALLEALQVPLAAPSANRFGHVSPTTAAHVEADFGAELPVLDGGMCEHGLESTIVWVGGQVPALLRPGAVTREAVEAVVGPLGSAEVAAPGTLAAHYAPRAALVVTDDPEGVAATWRAQGRRVAVLAAGPVEDHARRLYAQLRAFDAQGVEVVVAERAQGGGLALAINDRLQRAARGR